MRQHLALVDSVLAFALTVAGLLVFAVPEIPGSASDPLTVLLVAACCASVAFRRRWPFTLTCVTSLIVAGLEVGGRESSLSVVAVVILFYTLTAYRGLALSLAGMAVAAGACLAGAALTEDSVDPGAILVALLVLFITWLIGRGVRLRRAYFAELEDRAERLERARDADTRAARVEERSRIARELHDVVAHHVSVMTVQAAAARKVLAANPEAASAALSAIEDMGRTAMAEMRNIVGVLRTEDESRPGTAERGPQPGMHEVSQLVQQTREAGMRTQLSIEGERRDLPPGIDLAAFRLTQEALTNSLRHAGPDARAWVTVRYGDHELEIHVEDDGRGAAAGLRGDGRPGHGLVGIRERVALYGGSLRIGPRQGGGFEVRARFPLSPRTTRQGSRTA
ncbi:sensor histidine kinase [Bailinhaonella thermotolerans]|uniref:histidine kinase n=2 Tax=Bailinhaonella thermotolerans TaxID=1070861 RepID=A0A3A4BXH3_9ACTN|nr:sensor histidine kinase [Bailinhaonella thermotolerans]